MINSELKTLINSVFEKWTCTKRRVPNCLVKIYTEDCNKERQDQIKCCKAINPITKEERFVGADRSMYDTNELATNRWGFDGPQSLFNTIVDEVIWEQFDIESEEIDYPDDGFLYTMKRGRQFNEMLIEARPELLASSDYNKEDYWQYNDEDEFFKDYIMGYDYDFLYDKVVDGKYEKLYKEPEYEDGDKIEEELVNECYSDIDIYSPFKSRIDALKDYLWKAFEPKLISYIDLDFAISLGKDGYVDTYNLTKNQIVKLILDYCVDKEKVIAVIDAVIVFYKKAYQNESEFNYKAGKLKSLKSENNLDYIRRYIEGYMSEDELNSFIYAVQELKEFEDPVKQ